MHIKWQQWLVRRGDGVVAHTSSFKTHSEVVLVSDHPVCGASVASRLFMNAAATPPREEGKVPVSATLCAKALLEQEGNTLASWLSLSFPPLPFDAFELHELLQYRK